MKIVITGGTGQVGRVLARAFYAAGHEVVAVGRHLQTGPWRFVQWDAETLEEWTAELEHADAVINLAGRSVNCRYGVANRRLIMDSRVRSTELVGQAIARAAHPPRVWLQAGTATIYAHRFDAPNDETNGIIGGENMPSAWQFSVEVAKAWEAALARSETPHTRKVVMRSAMLMSPDRGGIFDVLLRLVRLGLGGSVGGGRQFVSWIHEHDFVQAVLWLIDHEDVCGVVNLAAPNPLPYSDFMRSLRRVWGTPIGLPATRWMIEVGAFVLRTESELVLKSRRVVPGRLLDGGFAFQFAEWDRAAEDLCARWKSTA